MLLKMKTIKVLKGGQFNGGAVEYAPRRVASPIRDQLGKNATV